MDKKIFYSQLISYLSERTELPNDWTWEERVNLFDAGILESFDLPDFVQKIEEITGKEIQSPGLKIEQFFTLLSIYETFVREVKLSC